MLSLSILSSKLSSYLCFHRLLFFIQITAMIHSLPLGKDCETSTSSQLSPCPRVSNGDDQEPAQVVIAQDDEEEELDKMNHDQLRSGGAIELDYCSGKANHGTEAAGINWTSSDHMIPLIPIKPTHYDSSCRNPARVCVDCNTTNTPLWRSGPQGPKSLCNACGIRYRKARRALSAIVASDDQSKFQSLNRPTLKRAKLQEHIDPSLSSRKRTKLAISGYSHCSSEKELNQNGSHQLCFKMQNLHLGSDDHHREELYYAPNTFSLGKRPAFRRVFPKDEVEAAVMLMALSCGLING